MNNYFRWSFVFSKDRNSKEGIQEILDYAAASKIKKVQEAKAGITELCQIDFYEKNLLTDDHDDDTGVRLISVLVIVFHGWQWTNFVNDILYFDQAFPESDFPRLTSNVYRQMDEANDLSDLPKDKQQ